MRKTTFESADTTVVVDDAGNVRRVAHLDTPDRSYFILQRPDGTRRAGADEVPLELRPARLAVDADEVELTLDDPNGLTVTIRHSFVAGWQTRCVLASSSAVAMRLDLRLPFRVPDSVVGWAVADGAEASLFLQHAGGGGPLLVGRLRQGAVARIGDGALWSPGIVLEPGARYVLALDWTWLPEPSAYVRSRPGVHPAFGTVLCGEPVSLVAGPDVAVVVPDGVALERDDDGYELRAAHPLATDVELRSARGLRTIHLEWTESPTRLLAEVVERVMAAPRGPVGVVRLPDLAAALVVQHALAAELIDESDEAADALDLFTARLDPTPADDPRLAVDSTGRGLRALHLCGEFERTGDRDLLERASDEVLHSVRAAPALGIAATRICVALVAAGASPQPVMDHMVGLAGRRPDCNDLAEVLSWTELLSITEAIRAGRSERDRSPSDPHDPLLATVLALGTRLGSGLPGRPTHPLPVERLGHLLAVFAMLPDSVAEPTGRRWGMPAADLATRLAPTLIVQLDRTAIGPSQISRAHVWLAILASIG